MTPGVRCGKTQLGIQATDRFMEEAIRGGSMPLVGNRLTYKGVPFFDDSERRYYERIDFLDVGEAGMTGEECFYFMTDHPYRRSQVRLVRSMLWRAALEKAERMMASVPRPERNR